MPNIPPAPTDADLNEALDVVVDPTPPDTGFPTARLVAFLGPQIAWLAGALASWLLVHVHFLGLFHLQHDGLSTGIAQGITFVLVTAITYAGQHKWLDGNKAWEKGLLELAAKAIEPPAPALLPASVVVNSPPANPAFSVGPAIYSPSPPSPFGSAASQTVSAPPTATGEHPEGDDYDSDAEQQALDVIDVEAGTNVGEGDLPVSPDVPR